MSRSLTRDAQRETTALVKSFKKSNPLLMRKKVEIKDVYFRKNEPERDVVRFEFAFDFEEYFIVAAGVILILLLACRIARWSRRRAVKREYARKHKIRKN